jgi:hypothetical protein
MITYYSERTLRKELHNQKMGFDYLPMNYEFLDRHGQNNQYMISLWNNESDYLERVIQQYTEFEIYGELK